MKDDNTLMDIPLPDGQLGDDIEKRFKLGNIVTVKIIQTKPIQMEGIVEIIISANNNDTQ